MSVLISVFLYMFVFVFSAACVYVGHAHKRISMTMLGIIPVIALGFFRYGIGADYANYLMSYDYYATGNMFGLGVENHNFNLEPFFQIVAQLSYNLTGTPLLFFGIPWTLTVLLLFFGLRRILPDVSSRNYALIWLLTITLMTPFAFDQVRQTLAIAIFFFSIKYILDKKMISYILMTVLASFIHTSSLFVMPVAYLLGRWILKKKSTASIRVALRRLYVVGICGVVGLYVVSLVNMTALSNIGLPYIDELLRLLHSNGAIKVGIDELVPVLLFTVSLVMLTRSVTNYDKVSAVIAMFLTIGAAIAPLSIFIALGGRVSQYFMPLVPIAVYFTLMNPRTSHKPRGGRSRKTTLISSPFVYLSFTFLLIVGITGWTKAVPYVSIFNHSTITAHDSSPGDLAPFYELLCSIGLKSDCGTEPGKIQSDSSIWRP